MIGVRKIQVVAITMSTMEEVEAETEEVLEMAVEVELEEWGEANSLQSMLRWN